MTQINRLLKCCASMMLLAGCSNLTYYQQLITGHAQLLAARQPIEYLLAQEDIDPALATRLRLVLRARRYASAELALPDNKSYRYYADLKRPYVVWNLFATEPYSLQAVESCFPIAGCVAYRGYYQQSQAREAATLMKARGLDTYVSGVAAYSSLGWFNDPVLNTMLQWSDDRLVAVIFHELAHQRFYIKDDSAFNESFATFVEQQGLSQWRQSQGGPPPDNAEERQHEQFVRLVLDSRQRLETLYTSGQSEAQMVAGKAAEFERLRRRYRQMRDQQWNGEGRYDGWFAGELNNASLLPFGLYNYWVPAFRCLFMRQGKQWPAFYREVERIGSLPVQQRLQALRYLNANITGDDC
ncbi:aminopeptidase [Dickeya dadantii subsp. dieffenbachiae]|uniref:aminopeptidase n=1 Tax=Dickeya dadantii TaxID=204038 RepID=UPI00039F3890|nr:aminopeptidase [Dickeya dadantii]